MPSHLAKPAHAVLQAGHAIRGQRLFLPFAEGAGLTARDSAGRNHGTLAGTVSRVTGAFGKCLDFDISGFATGLIDCGSGAALDDLGPLTFAAWLRPRGGGSGTAGRIIDKGGTDASGPSFFVGGTNPWILQFFRGYATTNLSCASTGLNAPINEWHRAAVTWDGTNLRSGVKFWIDGRSIAGSGGADGAGAIKTDAGNSLLIGNLAALTRGFDGLIDAPAVYNRVLTPAELLADYRDAWRSVRPKRRIEVFAMASIPFGTEGSARPFSVFGPSIIHGVA